MNSMTGLILATFGCCILSLCLGSDGEAAHPSSADKPSKETLVGINYFAGWWEETPNKWIGPDGTDWRTKYPDRVPKLGAYNDQKTMDREIKAAADAGVDFFLILDYQGEPGAINEPHHELLNRGLDNFLHSPEAKRMKFAIEYCNHPPFGITHDETWRKAIERWAEAMRNPSCLRVGGKIVFKIHGGSLFLEQNGNDLDRCKARLDQLRKAVRDAGLGEMLIGCGVGSGEAIPDGHWAAKLFDFTACYMDVPPVPQREADYPYDDLMRFIEKRREGHRADAIPFMPFIAAGWNPRPWGDPRPFFAPPSREEWREAITQVRRDLSEYHSLGLPAGNGAIQKAFTIYAWNEFGEGGYVAPTHGDGEMKLQVLKETRDHRNK